MFVLNGIPHPMIIVKLANTKYIHKCVLVVLTALHKHIFVTSCFVDRVIKFPVCKIRSYARQ